MQSLFNRLPRRLRVLLIGATCLILIALPTLGCADPGGAATLATGGGIPALATGK